MAAIVAHDALGLPVVPDDARYRAGRWRPGTRRLVGLGHGLVPIRSRPGIMLAVACGRCRMMQGCRLVPRLLDGGIDHGLVGDDALPSMPQEAEMMALGLQWSMRAASLCAAKPPNTTEWMAPSRAQASMATTASGTIGM
jgi:hypothetical protein